MAEEITENDAIKQIGVLRKEILELRTKVSELGEIKEKEYTKKTEISSKIKSAFHKIKALKKERDSLSDSISSLKQKRKEFNDNVGDLIKEAKKVNDQKKEISKKIDIKESPSKLKDDIDKIEFKLQTEVMSFENEKKLRKILKEKQKVINEIIGTSDVWKESYEISKKIDSAKDESDTVHAQIQKKAREVQKCHEEIIILAKEIDDLRSQEQEQFEIFKKAKEEYTIQNNILKEKLKQTKDYSKELTEEKREKDAKYKKAIEKELTRKTKEVSEKIKTGKKLTTEDLLVFQRTAQKDELDTIEPDETKESDEKTSE
ncbi:MAG TPA: hypothetical protein PLX15_00870 [Candidatus Woesearchaeota archaeon]|nr:hypothetical protein [Candidatus Woesearchaeota archaeon]